MSLHVKSVAFRNAPADLITEGYKKLSRSFSNLVFEQESDTPDIIMFLSGGSESEALQWLDSDKQTLLLADFEGNAYAAAMEVKAWADYRNIPVQLISWRDSQTGDFLHSYEKVCHGFRQLKGQRAGLIGQVSHWLVASAFENNTARKRLGLHIEHLPWNALPDYSEFEADPEFLDAFREHQPETLKAEAGIYRFLTYVMAEKRLDALTLECFEMVNNKSVTACLALALLNSKGIVAGCEGDLVSLSGMMLVKALTGRIPWMANLASIDAEKVFFAHCTIPLNLVDQFQVETHYETNKSAAIQGNVSMGNVVVFRLGEGLDKAFIAKGRIITSPHLESACRTQSQIVMSPEDLAFLKQSPLGNHHLIIPGNHMDILKLACRYKGIRIINSNPE